MNGWPPPQKPVGFWGRRAWVSSRSTLSCVEMHLQPPSRESAHRRWAPARWIRVKVNSTTGLGLDAVHPHNGQPCYICLDSVPRMSGQATSSSASNYPWNRKGKNSYMMCPQSSHRYPPGCFLFFGMNPNGLSMFRLAGNTIKVSATRSCDPTDTWTTNILPRRTKALQALQTAGFIDVVPEKEIISKHSHQPQQGPNDPTVSPSIWSGLCSDEDKVSPHDLFTGLGAAQQIGTGIQRTTRLAVSCQPATRR